MAERGVKQTLGEIETCKLIGRKACVALNPEIQGHIVRVITYSFGRLYALAYWHDGDMAEVLLDAFQLELL